MQSGTANSLFPPPCRGDTLYRRMRTVDRFLLAALVSSVEKLAGEIHAAKVRVCVGSVGVLHGKPGNSRVDGELEIPTCGSVFGAQVRLAKTETARPVDRVVEAFVRKWKTVKRPGGEAIQRGREQNREKQSQFHRLRWVPAIADDALPDGWAAVLSHDLAINVKCGARAFAPAEFGGLLHSETLHAAAEFRIEQDVGHASFDIVHVIRIEKQSGAIGHFRHCGSIRTGNCAAARHGFENGKAEPFVEGRENEAIAGVVKLQEFVVTDETGEVDAIGETGSFGSVADFGSEPRFLTGEDQVMRQLRVGGQQLRKGRDEADLVLAGLQVADREDERFGKTKSGSNRVFRFVSPDRAEFDDAPRWARRGPCRTARRTRAGLRPGRTR